MTARFRFGHDVKDGVCQVCHARTDLDGVCPKSKGGKWMQEQIDAIRESERITAADLAIVINARD